MDIPGDKLARTLIDAGVTHVVWLPDSALGPWETWLEQPGLRLVRVCREGEAWAIAAGLLLGGARPLVMIQNTGLFESGDAMRNVLFDLRLAVPAVIGYRGYLVPNSTDTARRFTEPVLKGWGLEYVVVDGPDGLPKLATVVQDCFSKGKPGIVLVAEGRG